MKDYEPMYKSVIAKKQKEISILDVILLLITMVEIALISLLLIIIF
jgi:hypothetical protein